MKYNYFLILLIFFQKIISQDPITDQALDEVVVSSEKINLPFSKKFRSIKIITNEEIINSPATNLSDLLQEISGIDIRRRGVGGVQGDLYVRGGGFDQTLVLIDGMKMDDIQTGHHTLNVILPLHLIERIEIIKGPAARIFGQNAFSGAINLVTKHFKSQNADIPKKKSVSINLSELVLGSFDQKTFSIGSKIVTKNIESLINFTSNRSDGYRYNTDLKKNSYFIKTSINSKNSPLNIITFFNQNKFGANGFYASPSARDQYEETQASLLGISKTFSSENLSITPKLYWRRGQDEYIYIRNNPSVYRNLHITNKFSGEITGSYFLESGVLGFGLDLSHADISSNNLGERKRTTLNLFTDYKFKLLNDKLVLSPGIAISYFSDMSFHSFPGLDIGLDLNTSLKLYSNIGKTYRIPTYTDLYYSDRTTIGNENLEPESAISTELGIKFNNMNWNLTAAVFQRNSKNLIDYVKENENDLWKANNIGELKTSGVEMDIRYNFETKWNSSNSNYINISYTRINDNNYVKNINFSRYSINSLKDQFISKLNINYLKNINHSITYKYGERSDKNNFSVLDSKIMYKKLFYLYVNNILDEVYSETNLVPMPGTNFLVGFTIGIN